LTSTQCGGCGREALGVVNFGGDYEYPGKYNKLLRFTPEAKKRLDLPNAVPKGIQREFIETEKCMEKRLS